ncbi:MAG: methyltransferase domain-containing protein [Alphaproteobacteria bacterium]|nr:methyltransferase domain-containing protein [Alphaproteobacteria bacterium]
MASTDGLRPMHVWQRLNADLHLDSLDHDYAPAGLLEMVPPGVRRALDIGCFCGGSGRWLMARNPALAVVGIEMLERAAAISAKSYAHVFAAKVDDVDFEDPRLGRFDAIVAADVLEHMVDPWRLLTRLPGLLAPGGALYVSVPNIRNLVVLQELVGGDFRYDGSGILDVTHLRFFTRRSALRMFAETGWRVVDQRINIDPRLIPVLNGRMPDAIDSISMGKATFRDLGPEDSQELFALQFYFRLQPAD